MVHPLVTEAVNYVSQRTELMMAAFFLLTLYTAQRASAAVEQGPPYGRRSRRGSGAVGRVLRDGNGVQGDDGGGADRGVPLRPDVRRSDRSGDALRRRWPYYAGLCATWLVLVALLWSSPRGDSAGFAGASVSPWTYLLNQSVMIVRYLRLAIWPRGLVLDYGEPLPLTLSDVAPYARP